MQLQQFVFALLTSTTVTLLVNSQTGPFPPRLSIPGAVVTPVRPQVVRVRRPIALRQQNALPHIPASVAPRILDEPKPVTEAPEDEQPDAFLPHLLREQQLAQAQQQQFQQAAAAFLNHEPNTISDTANVQHLLHEETPTLPPPRFPDRTAPPSPTQSNRPLFNDFGIGNFANSQRFGLERPTQSRPPPPQAAPEPVIPQRANIIRNRPAAARPQFEAQAAPVSAPARPRPKPIQPRPIIDQNQLQDERDNQQRRQRPVAQTIRKWREENEDGSITWGYENDDGSFKEEIIGMDCITKGTYGYIDPDGNKREYHYETGIKCDPNTRATEDELQENGFINYEENKAVLPNGIEIDMTQLGKKKSKRPGGGGIPASYRN